MSWLEETSWDPIKAKEFLCIPDDQLEILNSIPGWSQELPTDKEKVPKKGSNVPVSSASDSTKLLDSSNNVFKEQPPAAILQKEGKSPAESVPARKRSLSLSSCTDYEETEPKKLKSSSSESSLMDLDDKEVDLKEAHKSVNELFEESKSCTSSIEVIGNVPQNGTSPKKSAKSMSATYRVARLESLRENKMVISKQYSESCPLILAEEMIMMKPNLKANSRPMQESGEMAKKSPQQVPEESGENRKQLLQPEKSSVSVFGNAEKAQIVEQNPAQDMLAQSSENKEARSSTGMGGDVLEIPVMVKERASYFKKLPSPIQSSAAKKDVPKDEETVPSFSIPSDQVSPTASVEKDAQIEKSDLVAINVDVSGNGGKVPEQHFTQELLDERSGNNQLHSSVTGDEVFNVSPFKKPHTPILSSPVKKDALNQKDEDNLSSLSIPCGQIPPSAPEESGIHIPEDNAVADMNVSCEPQGRNTVPKILFAEDTAQRRSGKRSQKKKKKVYVSIEYTPEQIKTMMELVKFCADV